MKTLPRKKKAGPTKQFICLQFARSFVRSFVLLLARWLVSSFVQLVIKSTSMKGKKRASEAGPSRGTIHFSAKLSYPGLLLLK